ncbi:hypothetical protein [Accumulibacter sp.]|uniref:hypothetical protein n=1 Tax=Accumulibacter sp. TaxID=2053492 RepID=UPI001D8ECBB8|nr:hypothetical protein [Accumulibacter sp.]MCB1932921.1 hypothetical protein [Accumulibacter sp.]MCB1968461.1 hypothetical protein [Accumulibacter sp.]MCP5227315.1 hypothetical protein [Accumulibacter sp.]
MKAPKLLPWIANKTGISEDLALKLWRRSAGEAAEMTGCCDSSDYYRLAVERFIDLAEAEGNGALVRDKPGVSCVFWLWRHQSRISSLQLVAAQNVARLLQEGVRMGVRKVLHSESHAA